MHIWRERFILSNWLMGLWGGLLASLKFVRQPGRLVIKNGCFPVLESEFCRAVQAETLAGCQCDGLEENPSKTWSSHLKPQLIGEGHPISNGQ